MFGFMSPTKNTLSLCEHLVSLWHTNSKPYKFCWRANGLHEHSWAIMTYLLPFLCTLLYATRMMPSIKHIPYEESLRCLNLPTLKYHRLSGSMIMTYIQHIKWTFKCEWSKFFYKSMDGYKRALLQTVQVIYFKRS